MQEVKTEEIEEKVEEKVEEKKDTFQEVKTNEPKQKETELEKVLKMKKDDQIKYLLDEIVILRNQQGVLENRIARYKKIKKA